MNRQVLTHWTYSDIYAWRLWSHILFSAQFSEKDNQVNVNGYWITQCYGDFLYGRDSWSKKLQVPEQRLRTLMDKFEKEGMIQKTDKGNSRCTVYAVCNYAKFNQRPNQQDNQQNGLEPQALEDDANQHNNQHSNQRPTSDQPATNHNKEYNKNIKEEKEQKKEDIVPKAQVKKKEIDDFFESVWKLYPSKTGLGKITPAQKTKLYHVGYDTLKKCIERYKAYQALPENITWLKFQNGSTFFNKGYIDYLDENYKQSSLPLEQMGKPDALQGYKGRS